MNKEDMIAAIRAHASANYSKGWDRVVECYDDADIAREIDRFGGSVENVIRKLGAQLGILAEIDLDRMLEADGERIAAGEPPRWVPSHWEKK